MTKFQRIALIVAVAAGLGSLSACSTLALPGNTASITLVSTTTTDGWKYDYYRNTAYPCSVSGYQTFVDRHQGRIVDTAPAPLWAFMHGGGAGYFDADGNPVPDTGQKVEESAASLTTHLTNNGLLRADPGRRGRLPDPRRLVLQPRHLRGRRTRTDPHNPNTTARRQAPVTTNGIYATKAAIQFVQQQYPTTKTFLHGDERRFGGRVRRGVVDAAAGHRAGGRGRRREHRQRRGVRGRPIAAGYLHRRQRSAAVAAIAARVHPDLANIDERARQARVERSAHRADPAHLEPRRPATRAARRRSRARCATARTSRWGSPTASTSRCAQAIAAQGPTSRSKNFPVCVDNDGDARLLAARRDDPQGAHEHRPVDPGRLHQRHHDLGPRPPRRHLTDRGRHRFGGICTRQDVLGRHRNGSVVGGRRLGHE